MRLWRKKHQARSDRENVLIAVLCGNHMAHASLLQLANELDRFSALDSHRFVVSFVPITASPQELARNTACGAALERLTQPDDTLLMIDNDMIQQGGASMQILNTLEYDIAGGLQYMWLPRDATLKRDPDARPCAFMRRPDGETGQTVLYPQPGETQREVDRVGSGFMAIKRRVLADPRMHLAADMDPPALWRNVYRPNYTRDKGLDMDFCDRAKALGYRIVVNWRAEIGHHKSANVNEIDLYAKAQFVQGYELGVRHGVQMAAGGGGAVKGQNGAPGPHEPGDGRLVAPGMDRADADAAAPAAAG